MEYICTMTDGGQKLHWPATVRVMGRTGQIYEAEMKGRGSYFHLIAGRHAYGHFVCIPSLSVGSDMADCRNVGWNIERLSFLLPEVDAVTVAYGISHLEEAGDEYDLDNEI